MLPLAQSLPAAHGLTAYLLALLFGVIEGLTEFLPVSSTAHIRIAQFLCGINPDDKYWEMFAVVIQLGAILSVLVYFRGRIAGFLRTFPKGERGDRTPWNHPLTLVLIAFVVTAGPALILKKLIDKNLGSPYVMGASLVAGGVIMWLVDGLFARRWGPKINHVEEMGVADAVWIGAVQILSALFPGTSRSMCTIAAGQVFRLSRATALEFSFFLSIPTMLAATLKELLDYVRPPVDPVTHLRPVIHLSGEQWTILLVGLVVSFLVAWAVIAWFMAWVRSRGFIPFAIYRILVGSVILGWLFAHRA
jgi:undecaprenyl-diphosphatase